MERLTKRIINCVYYTKGKYVETIPIECNPNDVRNILKRLAEYEDTGLMPDEIKQNMSWNERHEELFLEIKARDKIIVEYEDKIECGELVAVVRCKDCVYVEQREGITNTTYHCILKKSWWVGTYYCCSGEKRSDNNG